MLLLPVKKKSLNTKMVIKCTLLSRVWQIIIYVCTFFLTNSFKTRCVCETLMPPYYNKVNFQEFKRSELNRDWKALSQVINIQNIG
jgi:hypothetical protein